MFLSADVAAEIHAEMVERVRAATLELCAKLAPLARRDPQAFDRAWCDGVDRVTAEALAHAREQMRRRSAPKRAEP